MKLVLRGHIRNAFDNNNLLNLIKTIIKKYNNIEIYIHTWYEYSNNLSWRDIDENNVKVNDKVIYDYFNEINENIKHIIIDNDKYIQLIGNINGTIGQTPMPIKGWKNYWYGKYRITEYLYNLHNSLINEPIFTMRFDILNNSVSFTTQNIVSFFNNNTIINTKQCKFITMYKKMGLDNLYVGNIKSLYKLTDHFYNNLDEILKCNLQCSNQEYLVYTENENIIY